MSDYLLQFVAGNLLVSSILAGCAWLAQTRLRRPMIAHLLWTLALIKLLTPPLFTLPVVPLPTEPSEATFELPMADAPLVLPTDLDVEALAVDSWAMPDASTLLAWTWLLGSALVLTWSLTRVARFQRLLRASRLPTTPAIAAQAAALARRFELSRVPDVHLTTARVTPMVWWLGARVQIYVPAVMAAELPTDQLRWILAHELGHVRRGDHYVRWVEWLTCVAFWWNPITWWARRNLRANEEVCCDALVMRTLQGSRHSYANSLLAAVEFLALPGPRPPAMASEINSGGFLQKRFEMIVSKTPVKTTPRWLQGALAACAALLMPLGVAYAQNPDVRAVAERLERAVKAGELSKNDMDTMLGALKKSAAQQQQKRLDLTEARRAEVRDLKQQLESLRRRVGAAVESGRIDKAYAEKLMAERSARLQAEADRRAAEQDRSRARRARPQNPEAQVEAVRRRVRAAVESGSMTPEEGRKVARERIEHIREQAEKQRQHDRRAAEVEHRDRRLQERELKERVAELRKRQADLTRRVDEMRRDAQKRLDRRDPRAAAEQKRLEEAIRNRKGVEAAKLFQDYSARQRQAAKKAQDSDAYRKARAQYQDVLRKLEQAVKDGQIQREEMAHKVEAYRRKLAEVEAQAKRAQLKDRAEATRRKLEAAVERGDLTEPQAKQKWADLQNDRAGAQKDRRRAAEHDARRQLESIKKRLEAAVKAGELSKQDARKKLAAIKKDLAAQRKADRKAKAKAKDKAKSKDKNKSKAKNKAKSKSKSKDAAEDRDRQLERMMVLIEAAVKRGDLSKEEAAKKFAAIKKELAAEEKDRRAAERGRARIR